MIGVGIGIPFVTSKPYTKKFKVTYLDKVKGSTTVNPHKAFRASRTQLDTPNLLTTEMETTQYTSVNKLDGNILNYETYANGAYALNCYSFNLIEAVERMNGIIQGDKVAWLKANINKLTCFWYGYGSSPLGNRATFLRWVSSNAWSTYDKTNNFHTSSSVTSLYNGWNNIDLGNAIDSNGFVHYLVCSEPSDGITASTISTDYIDLEIELL